jgi:anaerobic magnesium-protoporphyrin IX monomethyl ester cyclase
MSKSKKLDILFVNPGNQAQIFQSLGRELTAIENPVWAGLMATYCRRKGFNVDIFDSNALGKDAKQTALRVGELNPELVVVVVYGHQPSASTQNMPACQVTCNAIKELYPDIKILIVGGHVASLPKQTLEEESVDFVCSGEGPQTICELVEVLKQGRADYSEVSSLYYYDSKGQIQSTKSAPLIKDLDHEMPEVAWDLLPMEKYRAHNWHCLEGLDREPYVAIYTTLGCPYHCSFCCIQAPFKEGERALGYKEAVNSYRFWSPKRVIETLDTLVEKYGVKNVKFADEMFVLNRKHVEEICDLIIERGYNLNIWAYARVDTVQDSMIDKLKKAGFNWLAFGIESANKKVRHDVNKGFDQELIFKTIEKVRAAGINVIGNYIFGLPEDDLTSMQETLDLALELNCEFANFYCSMAYPGSPLYETVIKKEKKLLPQKWSGYSQHSLDMLPLATNYLSAGEVIRFRDEAFNTYFSSPKYLEMIENKFGVEAKKHIQRMLSHKLIRENVKV